MNCHLPVFTHPSTSSLHFLTPFLRSSLPSLPSLCLLPPLSPLPYLPPSLSLLPPLSFPTHLSPLPVILPLSNLPSLPLSPPSSLSPPPTSLLPSLLYPHFLFQHTFLPSLSSLPLQPPFLLALPPSLHPSLSPPLNLLSPPNSVIAPALHFSILRVLDDWTTCFVLFYHRKYGILWKRSDTHKYSNNLTPLAAESLGAMIDRVIAEWALWRGASILLSSSPVLKSCPHKSVLKIWWISSWALVIRQRSSRRFLCAYMLPIRDLWTAFCILLSFVFTGKKYQCCISADAMFTLQLLRLTSPPLYGRLIGRWRHGRCRASEIFNVGMSKPSRPAGGLRGAVSTPAGYGAAPRSKKYGS